MKKFIILIFCTLRALAAPAQEALVFTPDAWDFGTIREEQGRVSHTFTGENRSERPVVILDVVTSCGCTVPQFSRKPVLPGEKTQITVTFDPANRPGTFSKELGIYSSERRRIATLTVRGNVTPRPRSIEERYPFDAGGGVRLSTTTAAFAYLYTGQRMQTTIGAVNTSGRKVRLYLRPQEQSGLLSITYPHELAPGERAEINLAYLNPDDAPRYGSLRDVLQVEIDGATNGTLLMAHGIGVDRPADREKEVTPKCEISQNIIKFGNVKHAAAARTLSFGLANTRRADRPGRGVRRTLHDVAPPRHAHSGRRQPDDRRKARRGGVALRHFHRAPSLHHERPRAADAPPAHRGRDRGVNREYPADRHNRTRQGLAQPERQNRRGSRRNAPHGNRRERPPERRPAGRASRRRNVQTDRQKQT